MLSGATIQRLDIRHLLVPHLPLAQQEAARRLIPAVQRIQPEGSRRGRRSGRIHDSGPECTRQWQVRLPVNWVSHQPRRLERRTSVPRSGQNGCHGSRLSQKNRIRLASHQHPPRPEACGLVAYLTGAPAESCRPSAWG